MADLHVQVVVALQRVRTIKPCAWRAIALAGALCVLGVWAQPPTPSNPSKERSAETKQGATANQDHVDQTPLSVKLVNTGKSAEESARDAENEQNKAAREWWGIILAAGSLVVTIALAIITGLLARYTWLLWRATKRLSDDAMAATVQQASDTQSSLRIARDAADAATKGAVVAGHSIELARKEFIAARRPKLIVRKIDLYEGGGSVHAIRYQIHNVGDTPATIIEYSELLWLPKSNDASETPPDYPPAQTQGVLLKSGSFIVCLYTPTGALQDELSFRIGASAANCFFMGFITYQDEVGTVRNTAFLRRYSPSTRRFGAVEDSDYEYQD